jgi:serine protease Do
MVVLPDGRGFEATVVRGDSATDLAVIRIDGVGDLDVVQLGNSDDVRAGDWVVTLANPFELHHSLSAGVVSATNRRIPGTYHSLIQFDASTNPGSSGGALLNLHGEVIGIISGSLGQSERFQGIGMAIPVDVAKRTIARLNGPVDSEQAYLGCQTKALSPTVGKQLGLPAAGALYVEYVAPRSPAENDGLREGDIITHVGGQEIDAPLVREVIAEEVRPGKTYPFKVVRGGKALTVNVRMGTMPSGYVPSQQESQRLPQPSPGYIDQRLGLSLDRLDPRVARELGFPEDTAGVLVSDVKTGGLAYREGIAAGMIVNRIDDFPTTGVESYKRATMAHSDGKPLLMLLQSNEGKHLVVFEDTAR